jgi:hypothetical protein
MHLARGVPAPARPESLGALTLRLAEPDEYAHSHPGSSVNMRIHPEYDDHEHGRP